MIRRVVQLADAQGYPRDNLIVFHADLGKVEWRGVRELAEEQAQYYGLEFRVEQYRTKAGKHETLLDYVRRRGKWPSNTTRFCTSDFKRGPGSRVLTQLHRDCLKPETRMLNVFGFRAEESPARKKKQPFVLNTVRSTKPRSDNSRKREVYDWLPIHDMTEEQVWADIRESGVRYHEAYDFGMPRLSCCFCIFAPKPALMIAGEKNPELLEEYVKLEAEIGHDFKNGEPIADIKKALEAGERATPAALDGAWNM